MAKKRKKTSQKSRKPSTRGFLPAGQAEAKHLMDSTIKQAELDLRLKGIDAKTFLHVNRDGSIDAEIVVPSQRGKPTKELYQDVEEILPRRVPGVWISAGARFSARRDEDNYTRFKGLEQVQTYYRKWDRETKKALVLITMHDTRRGVATRVEKSQKKKVDAAFIRLHWNQQNSKPGREDARLDRRKGKKRKKKKK